MGGHAVVDHRISPYNLRMSILTSESKDTLTGGHAVVDHRMSPYNPRMSILTSESKDTLI